MSTNHDAFRNYLEFEKKYSPHTLKAYCDDLVSFQTYNCLNFDQDNIDQVDYSQIRSWIVSMIDDGVSNVSVNRKMASLRAYYRFLLKTKQIEISPLLRHKSLKVARSIQIPFSEKEMKSVLDQMQITVGFEQIRDKLIIDLLYTTGIRRAELIELKLQNIDLANNTIKVVGKRNKERILPILPIIISQFYIYIKERQSLVMLLDGDYFFLTKKGLKLNESFVYRLINSYFSTVSEKVKKVLIY